MFPYESSRKRMSVLVRLPPKLLAACGGGCPVRLYTKGADSVMLSLLADEVGSSSTVGRVEDRLQMENIDQLLDDWAAIALRTLVWCKRELPGYKEW